MARKLRLEFPGACYHVINRGNYKRAIFGADGTAGSFEKALFEGCESYNWRLHAYVIMKNHFHLALESPEPNLSSGMKWLQGTFAVRFNRYFGKIGRPFQKVSVYRVDDFTHQGVIFILFPIDILTSILDEDFPQSFVRHSFP